MNLMEIERENAYRRQVLLKEAATARLLEQAGVKTPAFPSRALLFSTLIITALGVRMKQWYRSAPSSGYLPNLHIE